MPRRSKSKLVDEKDLTILKILQENARVSLTEISKRLGISDVAVKKRLNRLEELGIIKGYTLVVDPSKLGYKIVAIVGLDTEPDKLLEVVEELKQKQYTRWVALTTGDHMIMTEIWAKDSSDLTRTLEDMGSIEGVRKLCPAIILDVVKNGLGALLG